MTASCSLTSVTVVPSATCWNQRRDAVSTARDLNDLDAILARYTEQDTAEIRRILAAHR